MALDLNQCFLTDTGCAEVERYAAYDFTATSIPTITQVESYAYMAAALLQSLTQRAGALKSPPASGVSPSWLKVMLTEANAIGAAYLARHHIYTLNGDARSLKEMERLAGLWQSFVGTGSDTVEAGVAALQYGSGGLIQSGIESASGSRLLVTPMSQGELALEDLSGDTQDVKFRRGDVD